MDPNKNFSNMQFSKSKLENHSQGPENYSGDDLEINQQIRMNNKPKIPMSYYFSQGEQGNLQKPFNKYEGREFGQQNQGYEEINYNSLSSMKNLTMSNINNMNINIINHIPMKSPAHLNYLMNNRGDENEELINNFSKMNIKSDSVINSQMSGMNMENQSLSKPPGKKDMAYNYYFGAQGEKQSSNSEENFSLYEPDEEVQQIDPRVLQGNFPQNFQNPNNINNFKNKFQKSGYGGMSSQVPFQNYSTPQSFNIPPHKNNFNYNKRQIQNSPNFNAHFKNNQNNRNKFNHKNNQDDNKYSQMSIPPQINTENNFIPGRYFVIKSLDEDNIHKSIKYRIWCSTIKGNQKLQKAFKEADNKYPIYLFFSVNGSGRFLGLAQMTSEVEYRANFNYWTQNEKWKGFFFLVWLAIKDIPNRVFRNIINEYNENKPVTASRDTQEIYPLAGAEMLKIFSEYTYETSILDDFKFYEQKQDNMSEFKQKISTPNPQKNQNINFNFNKTEDPSEENDNYNQNFNSDINKSENQVESSFNTDITGQTTYTGDFKSFLQQGGVKKQQNAPKRIIKRVNSTENILNNNQKENISEDENN